MTKPCAIPNSSSCGDVGTVHSTVSQFENKVISGHWGGGITKILNSRFWEFSMISMKPKITHAPNDQHCPRVSTIWNEIYPRQSVTADLYISIRHLPHTCFTWSCSPHTVISLAHMHWQKNRPEQQKSQKTCCSLVPYTHQCLLQQHTGNPVLPGISSKPDLLFHK